MRNRIIHGYDPANATIVWNTVQLALPPMISELERVLSTWPPATPSPR
jgi:uncharacterized protein with HEPN domain